MGILCYNAWIFLNILIFRSIIQYIILQKIERYVNNTLIALDIHITTLSYFACSMNFVVLNYHIF